MRNFVVTVSLFALFPSIAQTFPREALLYPCLGCPVIQTRGRAITVVVDSTTVKSVDRAWLVSSNDPVPVEVELTNIKRRSDLGRPIRLMGRQARPYDCYSANLPEKFPDGQFVPEDLYDLFIRSGEKLFSQPNAVKIVKEIKEKFYFVHLADTHMQGYDPNDISKYVGTRKTLIALNEINLLAPEFILFTGDVMDGMQPLDYVENPHSTVQDSTGLQYPAAWNLWSAKCNIPTFMLPGNHDVRTAAVDGEIFDGAQYWQEWIGPLYYSFDYGRWWFTCCFGNDWSVEERRYGLLQSQEEHLKGEAAQMRPAQLGWVENDLKLACSRDKNIVLGLHENPLYFEEFITGPSFDWAGEGQGKFLDLIKKYKVKMVNSGHIHYDHYGEVKGTKYVATTTLSAGIGKSGNYHGYRLIEMEGNEIVRVNYTETLGSIPSGQLRCEFEDENDGSARKNIFTVENELDIEIPVYIEFYMPKPESGYKYQITGGEESQLYLNWKEYQIYYVVSRVGPGEEKEIRIEQVIK